MGDLTIRGLSWHDVHVKSGADQEMSRDRVRSESGVQLGSRRGGPNPRRESRGGYSLGPGRRKTEGAYEDRF